MTDTKITAEQMRAAAEVLDDGSLLEGHTLARQVANRYIDQSEREIAELRKENVGEADYLDLRQRCHAAASERDRLSDAFDLVKSMHAKAVAERDAAIKRAEKAESAAAEMRAALEPLRIEQMGGVPDMFCPDGGWDASDERIEHALSSTAGTGWHSPDEWEEMRQDRDALLAERDELRAKLEAIQAWCAEHTPRKSALSDQMFVNGSHWAQANILRIIDDLPDNTESMVEPKP